jgi:hypothetical protein
MIRDKHILRYNWDKELWEEVYRVPSVLDLISSSVKLKNCPFCCHRRLESKKKVQ